MKDVVIVGAGPAGCSAAKDLADEGYDVVVYEKRQEIGAPKRCGEGLSSAAIENFGLDIPEYCRMQPVNGALVFSPNKDRVSINSEETVGWILERKAFDKWMAERAAKAGAKVRAKANVVDLLPQNKGVVVEVEGETKRVESRMVIAADGVESLVAKKAGVKSHSDLEVVDSGYQYEMVSLDLKDENKLELYFGDDVAPRGYVWVFPKGESKANVGIGIAGDLEETARYYLERFIETRDRFKNASIVEVNSGMIPVGGFLENMTADNFLAVGDAANQVNPIHGGGIREGIKAGKIASKVVNRALERDGTSEEELDIYNHMWWEERGKDLRKVEKLREVLEDLSDEDLNYLAKKLEGQDLMDFSQGKRLSKLGKLLLKRPKMIKSARKLL
ncbi:MAG: geranylgeranyl reductase family protein [Candidatus Aenigmatarchaeota archaeon]